MVERGTYFKPDGEPMYGLPATEAAKRYYLAKGFTLTAPEPPPPPEPEETIDQLRAEAEAAVVVEEEVVEEEVEPEPRLVCENCGRDDFKAPIGLIGHQRICKKEVNE